MTTKNRISSPPFALFPALKALRSHQWVKNLLVFLPFLLAHLFWQTSPWIKLFVAFAAFCCAASGIYVVNDILDAESDRAHPTKRRRPVAAGELSPRGASVLAVVLLVLAAILGAAVSRPFQMLLAAYCILSYFYSRYLKHVPVLDIFVLASFYSARLFAGALAAGVVISQWFLAFSTFFFLNLAFIKRFVELRVMRERGAAGARGYSASDENLLRVFGIVSGYLSALVLALYINSDKVVTLYHRPNILWAACFILLYWISRAWLVAEHGEMTDDPVVFVLTDRTSYLAVAAIVFFGLLAI